MNNAHLPVTGEMPAPRAGFDIHDATGAWLPKRELAERVGIQFGTPAFVYNADYIRANFANLRRRLSPAIDILYSLKANPNAAVVDCLKSCGAGAEVSSRAELHTAIRVGVPARVKTQSPY